MSSLFVISQTISQIVPETLPKAMKAASNVLRSEEFQTTLINVHSLRTTPHIDKDELKALLNQNNLFSIDKIRTLDGLNARALTLRGYDPWRIYVNPLLFIEFCDRERELSEAIANPSELTSKSLLGSVVPSFLPNTITPWTRSSNFNAVIYMEQSLEAQSTAVQTPAVQATKKQKIDATSTVLGSSGSQSTGSDALLYNSKVDGMSLTERHVLVMTLMLIHEVSHLLNYALSKHLSTQGGVKITPQKEYHGNYNKKDKFVANIRDVGHMVEKDLFGHVIQHSICEHYLSPFGIEHVIGTLRQDDISGDILGMNSVWVELVNGNNPPITKGSLNLTSVEEFTGRKVTGVIMGVARATEGILVAASGDIEVRDLEEGEEKEEGSKKTGTEGGYLPLSSFIRL